MPSIAPPALPGRHAVTQPPTPSSPRDSALYRRVWRWHFYAGLVCLPFLALMAVTGAVYLFGESIEARLYAQLRLVPAESTASLDAETLVARALAEVPGEPARFVAPPEAGRSAEVGIRTAEGTVAVFLAPSDGRVLGQLRDDLRPMEIVKQVHSLAIAGPVANHWVEVVAGWAIVLVVSGVFLWLPRGRQGGVYSLRGRPQQRIWWRDLHAVLGIAAAAAILFLAVTGMPWSAFWGQQFGRLSNEWGMGLPEHLWSRPGASVPLASVGDVPWSLSGASLPLPDPRPAPHGSHGQPAPPGAPAPVDTRPIGLDEAMDLFALHGVPAGTPVSLPMGPRGVYTAMSFPNDIRATRVVHLDPYSGEVLADVGYADFGVAGRLVEWGVSLHTGRQFGLANQLVMLAGCLAILALTASAVVMWWKRRPGGRLGAPPGNRNARTARGAVVVAALLGLLYPLLGASMLVAILVDALVPRRWHERVGL